MRYRLRWLTTASGFVGNFAGQWCGQATTDRAHLTDLQRAMPNGHMTELVTLDKEDEL